LFVGTGLAFAATGVGSRVQRPQIETGLRTLIRQMSIENPLWRVSFGLQYLNAD
jgi:hypothetical protein